MENQIVDLLREQVWSKALPKEYVIPSTTFHLTQEDIEFLINDDTNPDPKKFSLNQKLTEQISKMGGFVFAKFANRSAKDCSKIDRKIASTKDLIMLVKYSQFLTQALSEDENGAELIVRKYKDQLENETNEFRVYVIDGKVIGICQKNPSFLTEDLTLNQISTAKIICSEIHKQFLNKNQSNKSIDFTFDLFISPNGHQSFLLAVQPFYIHFLSLFTETELRKHHKQHPLTRVVEREQQLRQVDLSQYKMGSELASSSNVQQWINLMKGKQQEQS